jgi:hypothetical protein
VRCAVKRRSRTAPKPPDCVHSAYGAGMSHCSTNEFLPDGLRDEAPYAL